MVPDGARNDGDDESERGNQSDATLHEVSLSLDAILALLAHHHRRDLLRHLVRLPDQAATIDDCVGHLAEREAERTGNRPGRDHLEATLHHVHVPRLADAGVLEYDSRTQEIRYWGNDRLESWLERIRGDESEPD